MNFKKLFHFFLITVVFCLVLSGQVFADSPAASAGVSVKGKVTSYLPGVGCTVQLVQGGEVKYSTVIYSNAGHAAQEFAIPGVASGTYDLVITKPGHLSFTVKSIVVGDSDIDLSMSKNEQIANITLVAGDINGDGCVDLQDVTIITSTANYGQKPVVTIYEGASTLDDFIIEATETGITIIGVKDKTKTKYIVPNNVTSISKGAFEGCTNLESITLPFVGEARDGTENTHFGYIFGANAYANNKSYVPASLKTVVITDAANIGNYAFYNCTSLTSITIPNTVKTIGASAFYSCRNLTSVTIPNSVTNISSTALFYGCTSLISVTLPDSVTSIGSSAFENCTNLTNITLPNNVNRIGHSAFSRCTSLTSITIPDSVTTIDVCAFEDCSSLTSITIPDCVTSIEQYAFRGCTSLTSIAIPDSITNIEYGVFSGCTSLTSITIPDSVTNIGEHAFYGCSGLTSVYITDIAKWCSVLLKDMTSNPLYHAHNLYINDELVTDLVIPDGVTSIGNYAFYDCSCLTSISIPDSVTSIGNYAFNGCKNLTSITIPDSVTSIGEGAFNYCTGLTSITLPDGVTSIGDSAFYNCDSLTSITIPDGVTSIGNSAFYSCENLTSITIPDSVTSIGFYVFQYCTNLTSVTIPDGITSIGSGVFRNCKSLTSINFRGTQAQWEAITKGADWDYGTGNYTITYNYTGDTDTPDDTTAGTNGFSVGPVYNNYQNQENYYQHHLEFISNVTGTLWYYFTDDDKLPTAAAVKETVGNGGEGIIEANTMSVVKGTAVKLPLVFTFAPPAYMVVMLSDIDTDYQPMIVPTSGIFGSSNITTGFFRAPTVSTADSTPTLSYEANETGKLYYFFTNDSSALTTMWDFFGDSTSNRGYYSAMADGVKGVVDIKVGKGTVALPTSRSVTGYSHIAIMMQSAAGMPGGYRAPQIISLSGSSSGTGNPSTSGSIGFNEYPYISGNSLYVTPSERGTVYYCFTDSNSETDFYAPIKALAGLGLDNMDADKMSSYLATNGNGASTPVSYPGYRQTINLLSSSLMGYKYLAVWTVTSDNNMTSPAFVALEAHDDDDTDDTPDDTTAGTNGFSGSPQFYSWSGQITFTPSVSGQVAYFFTNSTTNYNTDQAFRNAYIQENTATSMIVSANQSTAIPANTSYKYVWIMLYTSTQYYIPVRIQIK